MSYIFSFVTQYDAFSRSKFLNHDNAPGIFENVVFSRLKMQVRFIHLRSVRVKLKRIRFNCIN